MIGGNYYFSRGIVQVNVLNDNGPCRYRHDNQALPSVLTHGNEVHNVARIREPRHDRFLSWRGSNAFVERGRPARQFLRRQDGRAVQRLDDSDRRYRPRPEPTTRRDTGGNLQNNFAQITNLDSYDIIIVAGDYIARTGSTSTNIVLDSDVAKTVSSRMTPPAV